MLVCAAGVHAGVELARDLNMSEFATFRFAVGAIAAQRHIRVLEVAVWVGAVREEPAHLFSLVSRLNGWRWMTTSAFAVFASGTKRANICYIDGCALGCNGRLVCERAVFAGAAEIEPTDSIGVAFILLAVHCSIHVDIGRFCTPVSVLVSATSLKASTTLALVLDPFEK